MATVGRPDSFLDNIIPLCVFLLIIMMSANSSKALTNVFTTGQILSSVRVPGVGDELGYANRQSYARLKLTSTCNLYLYDARGIVIRLLYSEGSYSHGHCTLSFTDNGRLVLTDNWGQQLWISSNDKSRVGKYIAVLLPDAELVIYGPSIWAVGEPQVEESNINIISSSTDINSNEMVSSMTSLKNRRPTINNVLFSGQILNNDDKIFENGYNFILDDCELILKDSRGKNSWQTQSHGNGTNCYARLDNFGGLSIFDDDEKHNLVWKNDLALPPYFPAEYVLVMQSNGTATIYGPKVWSSNENNSRDNIIKMPTVEM